MRAFKYSFPAAFGVVLLTTGASAMAGVGATSATVSGADPYVRQREVSYADLNLARVEDAAKLYGRIERTARDVCRTSNGPSAKAAQIERACAHKAVEDAVQDVSNTNLTAVHQAHASKRAMVASSR
jgi:UrcA family protein